MGMHAVHPIHALEREVHLLLEVERAGEQAESIFLALAGVMGVVLPIAAVMMVLAFGAAWIFG